ncbi:FitA-like ribbon-helix-helix domain-containing protein [Lichenicoccus sp.]|uniref:FitA-like ribbon-helix-helix domain-containing protein n=1 Tax=Lichenicoccus sp. TaxID=2781899 RepID=UPI003D0C5D1E
MPVVTVRSLPEETHRALRLRAASHGRSTEAEIRAILEQAVRPAARVRIGSELAAFGTHFGGVDLDIVRKPSPIEAATFE